LEMRNTGGNQSSANSVNRSENRNGNSSYGGKGGGGGRNCGGRGGRDGFGRGGGGRNTFQPGVFCQICGKEGHPAPRCFKRFDNNFTGPPQKQASSTMTGYGVDTNWYMDTGATDHITGELEKLTTRDKYLGGDQVHTASGSGMEIRHIGHGVLHSPSKPLVLKNILHVPSASKDLLSVHRITNDNNVFFEFHPKHYCVKDQETKRILLTKPCRNGLYPVKSINKSALGVTKPSTSLWHHRLGHPASPVVQRVLNLHKLPFVKESNKEGVCHACQLGKSHQLPYSLSTSASTGVLDLIFSDVWSPAPNSVSRNKYYVSFIDDYSKFTWIYLLRQKSEVFACFREFQTLVERQF
jgi:histone deacetylase 1/2